MHCKKIIFLVSLVIICAMLTVFASAEVEITVGSATYTAKTTAQTVDIPVTVKGNTDGITGIHLEIGYDEGVTLTKVKKGSSFADLSMTGGHDYAYNPYPVIFDTMDTDKSNGELIVYTFTIPANSAKDFALTLTVTDIYDYDMNDMEYSVINGGIYFRKQNMNNLAFNSATKEFNGEKQSITVTGAPAGATVAYTVNGEAFTGARNVGTYDITAYVTCPDYNDKTLSATLTINPKELTIKNLKVNDKEYDGTTEATWTGELDGLLEGTDVEEYNIKIEFDEAKANDKAYYSVNLSMSGDYVMNYTFTAFKGTARITPRVITVTADDKAKMVGEVDPELTYVYDGVLLGDDFFEGTLERVEGEAPGEYDINIGTLSLGNNYEIIFNKGIFTIEGYAAFTISDAEARPGDTVKLTVSLKSLQVINSIAFSNLQYDRDVLEFVGFGDFGEIEDMAALPPVFDVEKEFFLIALAEDVVFDGDICTLEFKVKENATDAVVTISATPLLKYDAEVFTSTVEGGEVKVYTYLKGDIDGDEDVDVDDAVYLFGTTMLPHFYPNNYRGNMDFDHNGTIDLQDALLLFNYSMLPDIYPIE